MPLQSGLSRFSISLLASAALIVLLIVAFLFYIRSEKQVASANELRYRSLLLAEELRQSSDDLTRMARTYVITGQPEYKEYFRDILDIRDGRKPRPASDSKMYWDLMLPGEPAPRKEQPQAVPLMELMRQAAFSEAELGKLAEAKARSDALTAREFEAMRLAEITGPQAEASRANARSILHDGKYQEAKLAVMRPIHEFLALVDHRTLAAVQNAQSHTQAVRYVFVALGLALVLVLWRAYAALRDTLGGSLNELSTQIARIGSGDFSSEAKPAQHRTDSVLGWLSLTRAKLNDSARERSQAQQALRQSEERLTGIVDSAMDAIISVDAGQRIELFNRAAESMFGYRTSEVIGRSLELLIPRSHRKAHQHHVQEFGRSGATTRRMGALGSISGVRADGAEFPIEASISQIVVDGQKVYTVILRDISQRRRSEAALKSIEWMLNRRPAVAQEGTAQQIGQPYGDLTRLNTERTILDAVGPELLQDIVSDYLNLLETSSAVYEKNGDYAFGIFTSGWCQAMDLASFRGCGTSDNRAALSCGKWHCHESCWNEASRVSMQIDRPTDIECQGGIRLYAVPIHAGDEIIGSINFGYGDPPRDPAELEKLSAKYGLSIDVLKSNAASYDGRPPFIIELAKQRLLGSARLIGEIVQRKRAETALRRLNATLEERVTERTAELQAAVQDLESFAYSVSHDLRAPLRAMNGFSELVRQASPELNPDAQHYLERIRVNAQNMGILIDALLAFSRLGRHALTFQRVDTAKVVQECLETLQSGVAGSGVTTAVGELPACQGDLVLLKQVWMNLLSNAFKFTSKQPQPQIEIGSFEQDGTSVYFVRDNGAGFQMRYADKLFGVFQRLHRADEYPGTGVGLANVQRIVQRHGGRVWAQATPNQGATFYFTVKGGNSNE